jgi:membrane-associated phospholipid phosphatase
MRAPTAGDGGWDDFVRLDPDVRLTVLAAETAPLFRTGRTAEGLHAVSVEGAAPLLVLEAPDPARLALDLPAVRSAADLRADRMSEILAQQGDMLSFFGAQTPLHPERMRWTRLLLLALYEAVVVPEMRLKLAASLPRPHAFAPQVQPIIETPSHGTWPSGHATEAFAFATVLALLDLEARRVRAGTPPGQVGATLLAWLGAGPGARPEDLLPFRLAARIADNRTVAGLHFPTDSAHGALLGLALGLAFAARCGLAGEVPTFSAAPSAEPAAFTLNTWREGPGRLGGKGPSAEVPEGSADAILPRLWQEALEERL